MYLKKITLCHLLFQHTKTQSRHPFYWITAFWKSNLQGKKQTLGRLLSDRAENVCKGGIMEWVWHTTPVDWGADPFLGSPFLDYGLHLWGWASFNCINNNNKKNFPISGYSHQRDTEWMAELLLGGGGVGGTRQSYSSGEWRIWTLAYTWCDMPRLALQET